MNPRRTRDVIIGTALAVLLLVGSGGAADALIQDSPPAQLTTTESGGTEDRSGDEMGGMSMRMRPVENGVVVNENTDRLPPGCNSITGTRNVTIRAGRTIAAPGEMFAYKRDVLNIDSCTKVNVMFVNEDEIRHQWMIHGLPERVYPMGMFNVEVSGPGTATGTFITPAGTTVLHTHCSLPQHEQKGMHMDLLVGGATPPDGTPVPSDDSFDAMTPLNEANDGPDTLPTIGPFSFPLALTIALTILILGIKFYYR
jgi:hypothetical protein